MCNEWNSHVGGSQYLSNSTYGPLFWWGGTSSEVFPETLEEVMSLCNPGTSTSQLFNLCKLISCKSLYQLQPIEIGSLCDKN